MDDHREGIGESVETRYPDWDVMNNADHWDEHTANLIQKRLDNPGSLKFFKKQEAQLLHAICVRLLADADEHSVGQVLAHIDKQLAENISAGYWQVGIPEGQVLYRKGLHGVEETAKAQFRQGFMELDSRQQTEVLKAIADGHAQGNTWTKLPAQKFFKQLLQDAIEIYASLPTVWSAMGYAGPAYPRGYVRIELGATDPWEAREPHA